MSEIPPLLVAGLLAVAAVVLVGPGPSWVARWTFLRRVPRAAVVLWQAGAVAALLCVLGLAWIVLGSFVLGSFVGGRAVQGWQWALSGLVGLFALLVVARLLWALARVIGTTGARRRRHRDLIDLLAREAAEDDHLRTPGLRVLAEERPLAYCVPGLRESRVVLSAGTLAMLSAEELSAVLAHERAHLRARHDVVLATFDAVHQAFPHAIRSELPAEESRLLVEMLADDAAVREVGRVPLGRAMVALSGSAVPVEGIGVAEIGAGPRSTRIRLERLASSDLGRPGLLSAAVYLLAVGLVAAPLVGLLVAA